MDALPRMISIAMKKYAARPDEREPAVRMLLLNVVRLTVSHLGREKAASLVLEALQEPTR